jgi:hypothetical protein
MPSMVSSLAIRPVVHRTRTYVHTSTLMFDLDRLLMKTHRVRNMNDMDVI